MGMRTRKHAMVLLLPTSDRQHALRHVAAMQRAVREYVAMAQRLQPLGENAHEAARGAATDANGVEATRLLLSVNVLLPVGNGGDVEMARAVAISGQANQVPRQIARILEGQLNKWRRLCHRGDYSAAATSEEDARSRCAAFLRLVADLAVQQFVVSVLTPADALPFGGGLGGANDLLTEALQAQVKIQFIMLRDEDEQSDVASQNVLELLRGIKKSANRNCSVRQVEECEIDLQGVVKEWLHAAAPVVKATLQLGHDHSNTQAIELQIRANFVLLQADEMAGSSWMPLCGAPKELKLVHLVPLASVQPTVLLGCPLRATPVTKDLDQGAAFGGYLRDEGHGCLCYCKMKNGFRNFYLLVGSTNGGAGELLMYRVASAEEILIPELDTEKSTNGSRLHVDESELERFRSLPIRDFNAFSNRSGILDVEAKDPAEPTRGKTASSRALPAKGSKVAERRLALVHVGQPVGPTAAKKKRRL